MSRWSDAAREAAASATDRAKRLLDRHRDRPLIALALALHERDAKVAGSVISSAIAFRLFLFFVPLLLLLAGIASQISVWIDPDSVLDASKVGGSLRGEIRASLDQPGHTRWIAIVLGLVGVASAGRTLSKTAVAASALAWQLPVRAKASPRMIGSLIGLIATIGLVAAVVNRVRVELGIAVAGVSFIAAFVVYLVAWMLLLALLPRSSPDPATLLPGAVLIAAVTAGLQVLSQLYLPDKIAEASDLYGAFGATITTLGWFFALGRAITVGMALSAVVHEQLGSISSWIFGLPLLRALPRRSAAVRRFFDLEDVPSDGRRTSVD